MKKGKKKAGLSKHRLEFSLLEPSKGVSAIKYSKTDEPSRIKEEQYSKMRRVSRILSGDICKRVEVG